MEYVNDIKFDAVSWISKYRPETVDQLIGNTDAINFIGTWLLNFDKNKIKALHDMKNKKRKRRLKIQINDTDDIANDAPDVDDVNDVLDDIIDDEILDGDLNGDIKDDEAEIDRDTKIYNNKGDQSCCIVIGNHGVGKTCLINAILKSMGYMTQTINFSKIKKSTDIKEAINNIIGSSNIISIMEGKNNKKVAIVIDEIEAISSGSGKTCVLALLKNNIINWTYPTIFISDGRHSKLLTEIKKNSHVVKLPTPFKNEMLTLMKKILTNEKMSIQGLTAGNITNAYNIIEHAQKDYRRLILTLYDLKYAYGTKMITDSMIEEYLKLSKKKDEDFDLFKAANMLLQKYENIESCIKYYETDKVVLPLMVQQNYLECITSKTTNELDRFDLACSISALLAEGDVIENYIYGDQNWDINEVHGYLTCVAPSYLLTNKLKKEKYLQLNYPVDLNKKSISNINKRNVINASKAFKNKNIDDYIYINLIIRVLTSEDKLKDCVDLLHDYNISISNIESLLKIDKIKTTKTSLSSKQKKEISSYLE